MPSRMVRMSLYGLALAVLVFSMGGDISAAGIAPVPVPEIDGGTISTGLAGLSAGVLILRARRNAR